MKEKEWVNYVGALKTDATIKDKNNAKELIKQELTSAIKKLMLKKRFGIFFSGGIDSTIIAFVCKKLKADFICYAIGLKNSQDLIWAKKVAKKLGFKLKIKELTLKEAENAIRSTAKLMEKPDVVNVGVGSVVYEAIILAKKDKIDTFFSGLGSEEIFAGYERHKVADINAECWNGLRMMWERDIVRDFTIADKLGAKLLLPFLEAGIIKTAMQLDGNLKIKDGIKKMILREAALDLKIPEEFAMRKKKAAQYGSNFDKAISKLAKRYGFVYKKDYLDAIKSKKSKNLAVLFSSGKDSCYAAYKMLKGGHNISCLITIKSKNPDSYMFHTPNIDMAALQSRAMGIPLITQTTLGEKEKELKDMENAIKKAKQQYGVEGIVTGALFSQYQKSRIEKICKKLKLRAYSPLWHVDQEEEMRGLIRDRFEVIISSIAAYGLDKSWLGRRLDKKDVDRLATLNQKLKLNIAGEGGEFETLVIDCPLFNKKIKIVEADIVEENENTAKLVIKKAVLVDK